MNKANFYAIMKILAVLFLLTSLYGLISYQLMPLYQLIVSANRFNLESLITGKSFLFLNIVLFVIFLLEPKKISLFILSSFLFNLILIKIIGKEWEIFYSLNMAGLTVVSAFIMEYKKNIEKRNLYNYGLFISGVFMLFGYLTVTTLSFMIYILPSAYDTKALFIDNFYHIPKATNQIFYFFNDYIKTDGYIEQFFFTIYSMLSLAIFLLAFWEYTNKGKRYFINTLSSLSILFIIGASAYILFPIMGPKYLQLSLQMADNKSIVHYIHNSLLNSIYARNGMPSLHFGLSLILLLNSHGLSIFKRFFFTVFFILTAMATVILKEHYFIDWIGAMPFVMLTLLFADKKLNWNTKKYLLLFNLINLVIWYAFLWFGIELNESVWNCLDCSSFNISMSIELYSISLLTLFNLIYSYKKLYLLGNKYSLNHSNVMVGEELKSIFISAKNLLNTDKKKLSFLFVLSGFSGLIYQIVFSRMLANIFGSTSITVSIVLATYMIGLSIGAFISTKNESKVPSVLRYALCEGLVSFYCALTPIIFIAVNKVYIYLANDNIENVFLTIALKFILSLLALILPTVLMGMTTPILIKEFNQNNNGISFANLYSLKTLGALLATIISGYFIIELLGLKNTIYMTVLLNLFISAYAISIYKKNNNSDKLVNKYIKDFFLDFKELFSKSTKKIDKNYQYNISKAILFVSGMLTMTIEIVYTHSISIVIGNSTYGLSIILCLFLLGLTIGGFIGKKMIEKIETNFKILSILEISLGTFLTISYFLIDLVPGYFGTFSQSEKIATFESRELLKFSFGFIIMIIPAILSGLIYTISMDCLNKSQTTDNNVMGTGIFINTIGNVIGIFLGSFYFINQLQIQNSFKVLTLSALIVGLLLSVSNKKVNKKITITSIILIITFVCIPYQMNMNAMTSGNNIKFTSSTYGNPIEYHESIDGKLTSVNKAQINKEIIKTLLINGANQGNDSAESIEQEGFVIAPILQLNNRNNALVIGYGTGITTKAIYDSKFKNIDVVDLNSDILNLSDKYFKSINDNVREKKNVKTYISDGRNYLKLTNKQYDLISIQINSLWFYDASSVYNKDFYEIAKQKLAIDGVLAQTVQLKDMNPNDFNIIVNTIRNQFKYVSVYYIGHKVIIVATNSEKNKTWSSTSIEDLNDNKNLSQLKSYYGNDFNNVVKNRILNYEETDKMLLSIYGKNVNYFTSTDDNLYLEYKTPKTNVLKIDTETIIINNLMKYHKQ